MKARTKQLLTASLLVVVTGTLAGAPPERTAPAAPAQAAARSQSGERDPLEDKAIAAYRIELLELAFGAAASIPVDPHVKDRCRAMAAAAEACLQLDQPRRALRYVEVIDDWRRGAGFADVAFYCAQRGYADEVTEWLRAAGRVADAEEDWRRDHVQVKIARVHAWLGQEEEAARLEAGVEDAEAGKVDAVRAQRAEGEALEERIRAIESVIADDNFDLTRNALTALAELFDRRYDDEALRVRLERSILAGAPRLPLLARVDLLMDLAESALDHGDRTKALELVEACQLVVAEGRWTPEYGVPVKARLAALRHRAGGPVRARADLDSVLASFDGDKHLIGRVFRAESLRPVAEALQSMGDAPAALAAYKRVVEVGADNPNARPRAMDLSATCLSMALSGVEPDEELWARIRGIRAGLCDPW